MKKKFVAISIVIALILLFNSCKKDNPLIGTTWESGTIEYQSSHPEEVNTKYNITLIFFEDQASAKITHSYRYDSTDGSYSRVAKGLYTYHKPNVTMNIANDYMSEIWYGKIDKKTMTLNVTIYDLERKVVFTKQE